MPVRKKKYPAYFALKITDSDAENPEATVWFDFSKDVKISTQKNIKFS